MSSSGRSQKHDGAASRPPRAGFQLPPYLPPGRLALPVLRGAATGRDLLLELVGAMAPRGIPLADLVGSAAVIVQHVAGVPLILGQRRARRVLGLRLADEIVHNGRHA